MNTRIIELSDREINIISQGLSQLSEKYSVSDSEIDVPTNIGLVIIDELQEKLLQNRSGDITIGKEDA